MALFKDTGAALRLDYFRKMNESEASWDAARLSGNHVLAEHHRQNAATYAALLTAVSTMLLTK